MTCRLSNKFMRKLKWLVLLNGSTGTVTKIQFHLKLKSTSVVQDRPGSEYETTAL